MADPKICGNKYTKPCDELGELPECVRYGNVVDGWAEVYPLTLIVTDPESGRESPRTGRMGEKFPEGARRPGAHDLVGLKHMGWLGKDKDTQGRPRFNAFCRSEYHEDSANPGKFVYDIFASRGYMGEALKLLTFNHYDPFDLEDSRKKSAQQMIETSESFELTYDEGMALISALGLSSYDFACAGSSSCVEVKEEEIVKIDPETLEVTREWKVDYLPGKFFFTSDSKRVKELISKAEAPWYKSAWNFISGSDSPAIEGVSEKKRKAFVEFLERRLPEEEPTPSWMYPSYVFGAIGAASGALIAWIFWSQRNDHAEVTGQKVRIEDMAVDVTKKVNGDFAANDGRFEIPYKDHSGLIDKMLTIMRSTDPRDANIGLFGKTGAGKSVAIELLTRVFKVEEEIFKNPAKAAEIEAKGLPRAPEHHREWMREYFENAKKLGQPAILVNKIDTGKVKEHGALWKDKIRKMVGMHIRVAEKRAKQKLLTILAFEEAKDASTTHRSIGDELQEISIIEMTKPVAELKGVTVVLLAQEEHAGQVAKDSGTKTRQQPVYVSEAPVSVMMDRAKDNEIRAKSTGVVSVADDAMKAIIALSRELKPAPVYSSSVAQLMDEVAFYAQSKKQKEITLSLFKEFYDEKYARSRGQLFLEARDLDAHVKAIDDLIELRNFESQKSLNDVYNGTKSEAEHHARIKEIEAMRYIPSKPFFGPRVVHDDAAKVSRAETVADVLVQGAKMTMLPGAEAEADVFADSQKEIARINRMIAELSRPERQELSRILTEKWEAMKFEEKKEASRGQQMIPVGKHYMPLSFVEAGTKAWAALALENGASQSAVKGALPGKLRDWARRTGRHPLMKPGMQKPVGPITVKPMTPQGAKAIEGKGKMKALPGK